MSCADVMYQPYSPYFPYQRAQMGGPGTGMGPLGPMSTQMTTDYRKFSSLKSHTDTSPSSLDVTPTGSPAECRPLTAPASATISRAPIGPSSADKAEDSAEAQYLSANCILFAYYSGDIASVVDEHFTRALSQVTSYAATPEATVTKEILIKDGPPMSHRNFPPSFWNSNYQPNTTGMGPVGPTLASLGAPDLSAAYGSDPYHHHPGSLHATLHHQNDPWHYTLASQATGHFGHRTAHDLSPYHHHPHAAASMAGPSRFAPHQYGSLLLQPSVRSAARLGSAAAAAAACAASGLDKTAAESWGGRYHDAMGHPMEPAYGAAAYGSMAPVPGLEGQPQESKDLYWF